MNVKPLDLLPSADRANQQKIEQLIASISQHQMAIDALMLRTLQQQQIMDQYRIAIYNLELRFTLLVKMVEEKGLMAKEEFDKRWPVYLKNDVGILEGDGKMSGSLRVTFYGAN
jgi:hypothetical protein